MIFPGCPLFITSQIPVPFTGTRSLSWLFNICFHPLLFPAMLWTMNLSELKHSYVNFVAFSPEAFAELCSRTFSVSFVRGAGSKITVFIRARQRPKNVLNKGFWGMALIIRLLDACASYCSKITFSSFFQGWKFSDEGNVRSNHNLNPSGRLPESKNPSSFDTLP